MLEEYKMDEKINKKIKEIRIGFKVFLIWYILALIVIIILIASYQMESSINSMFRVILGINIFMFVSLILFNMAMYGMWEDIIKAIEEYKNNKSKK